MLVTDMSNRKLGALLEARGIEREPFDVFIEDVAGTQYVWDSVDSMLDAFEESFAGAGTLEDYVIDYVLETLALEGTAYDYFNFEAYARDLRLDGSMLEARGYVFYGSW